MLDTIQYIESDVATIGIGGCIGMAGFLLAMGKKSKRYALRNTCIMLHPDGTANGQAIHIYREACELLKLRDYINQLVAKQSGQPLEKVTYDLKRNLFMTTEEALDYGLIDKIVTPSKGKLY